MAQIKDCETNSKLMLKKTVGGKCADIKPKRAI